ncbi:MAG: AAA family ATPase [Actinobacteria bacterium]|nr:AAA family ATPase [Actinomycetota bacterium]
MTFTPAGDHDRRVLQARLFGPLDVAIDGRPLPELPGLRPRALLAWLLLHPGIHSRARLAARFWPDVLDTSARASLRSALWTIRATLDAVDGGQYLVGDRASVGIAGLLPRNVDTEEFEALRQSDDPALLEHSLALVSGPLLADLADEWVLEARDAASEKAAQVALRIAEIVERDGDAAAAVRWTRRALAFGRLNEAMHRLLMRRLADAGERAEALEAYRRCGAVLAAEFGTAPSAETRALAAELRRGTAEPHPAGAPPRRRVRPPTEPLLGREEAVRSLDAAWDAACQRPGGVAVVTGAAGLGKTRLAEHFADRVTARGGASVTGAAVEMDGAPPFAPWSEVLRELVAVTEPPPPNTTWPDDLARICRSAEATWGRRAATSAPTPELERARIFEAVVETLDWAAANRPLLVMLDDMHVADAASLALLAYAGARVGGRVLILLTRRPTPAARIAPALDALVRRGTLLVDVALEPLSNPDMERLVEHAAPGLARADRAAAVCASEGNPLIAREAALAMAVGGDPGEGMRAWVRAPLHRLPPSSRLLVDVAAAAGRAIDSGESAELVGPAALDQALDDACESGLLEIAPTRRIRFRHGLVRDACYSELTPSRRAWLHGRIADVLTHRPGRDVAEIARHLVRSGDEAGARRYLAEAAERARSLGALDDAAAFLREACHAAAGTGRLEADLWLELGGIESWRGNRPAYDAAFASALAILEAEDDALALAAAYVSRGRSFRTVLCYPVDARSAYESALSVVDERGVDAPEVRALALAGLAWTAAMIGDPRDVEAIVAAAARLQGVDADRALAAELEHDRAAALLRLGRVSESEAPRRSWATSTARWRWPSARSRAGEAASRWRR